MWEVLGSMRVKAQFLSHKILVVFGFVVFFLLWNQAKKTTSMPSHSAYIFGFETLIFFMSIFSACFLLKMAAKLLLL